MFSLSTGTGYVCLASSDLFKTLSDYNVHWPTSLFMVINTASIVLGYRPRYRDVHLAMDGAFEHGPLKMDPLIEFLR